jgi:RimJ/RimL family protein N-acetyltransferase
MTYTDLELLEIQAAALYIHDDNKKLLRINESDPDDTDDPAPRFFLARSLAGNIWRVRHDLPDDLAAELERLAAAEPVVDDLREAPYYLAKYTELLAAHAPITDTYTGPAYYLPQVESPPRAILLTPQNRHLAQPHFNWIFNHLEALSPVVVIVEGGVAVTACSSVRLTPYAAEAGVHTEEPYRGRGYAVDAVRGWTHAVHATGRLPLYSTWWGNTASQAVAAKLGAIQYGVDFNIT